jgi:hypothetical protein
MKVVTIFAMAGMMLAAGAAFAADENKDAQKPAGVEQAKEEKSAQVDKRRPLRPGVDMAGNWVSRFLVQDENLDKLGIGGEQRKKLLAELGEIGDKLKELQKDDFSDFIEMEEFESFEENVQGACRINLTKWVLKDNPEVANRIGKYANDEEYVLYWNGAEGAWKFYETLEWEPIYISEDDLSDDDMKWSISSV